MRLEALAIAERAQQARAEARVANGVDEDAAPGTRLDHRQHTGLIRITAPNGEGELVRGDRRLLSSDLDACDRGVDRLAEEWHHVAEAPRRIGETLRTEPALRAEKIDQRLAVELAERGEAQGVSQTPFDANGRGGHHQTFPESASLNQ